MTTKRKGAMNNILLLLEQLVLGLTVLALSTSIVLFLLAVFSLFSTRSMLHSTGENYLRLFMFTFSFTVLFAVCYWSVKRAREHTYTNQNVVEEILWEKERK